MGNIKAIFEQIGAELETRLNELQAATGQEAHKGPGLQSYYEGYMKLRAKNEMLVKAGKAVLEAYATEYEKQGAENPEQIALPLLNAILALQEALNFQTRVHVFTATFKDDHKQ